jgi:hypothetical protein
LTHAAEREGMPEEVLAQYGANLEVIEDTDTGEVFIDNAATGTRIGLGDYLNIVGGLGEDGNPIPGTSHFESLSTGDATITDATVSNFTNSPTGTYGKTIAAPTPTAYFSGPAHGEGGGAFFGATLAPDGRVVFAPRDSSNVGIVSQLLDIATANSANR